MGKSPGKFVDETGNRYGRLVVLKRAMDDMLSEAQKKSDAAFWLCQCDCGNTNIVRTAILRNGTTKSCGCLHAVANRKRMLPKGIAAMHSALVSYQIKARDRNLEWNLTEDQFIQLTSQPCYYCGVPPHNLKSYYWNGDFVYSGIDRIDNDKGYSLENVVPCCGTCNWMKATSDKQEFLAQVKRIARYQGWL